MPTRFVTHAVVLAIVIAGSFVAAMSSLLPAAAQGRAPLPAAIADLARALEGLPDRALDGELAQPDSPPDPAGQTMRLRGAIANNQGLLMRADPAAVKALAKAQRELEAAWDAFGDASPNLSHLDRTADALHHAASQLKVAAKKSGPDQMAAIMRQQQDLADLTALMAGDLYRVAQAAGVPPSRLKGAARLMALGDLAVDDGRYDVGVAHFGGAMKLAANTVTFDVALYEQNIEDALAGKTVGYAFSTAYNGQLYQGGESFGLARTAADAPQTNQSPAKEMHVASVSKTITAILVHRLLALNGITPDTPVAPYLPSNWTLGDGVADLTFADFMTHQSGFSVSAGNSYDGLRDAIAMDVTDTSYEYSNANYGLMRVAAAGLMGIDPVDYPEFSAAGLTAAAFLIYADQVYDPIGVHIDCESNDNTPTIQYNFPDGGASGYLEPDRQLSCGGVGWFISSNELAGLLANLRHTENLLSTETRAIMEDGFLGFNDPARWSWSSGVFGIYYNHGGDWGHGSGELHSCAMAFPISVETGLVINSERGPGMAYQCVVLKDAFESAWVAK